MRSTSAGDRIDGDADDVPHRQDMCLLDRILRLCAERGDLGQGKVDALVSDRLVKMAVRRDTFIEYFRQGARILEIRTAPMPQGGIVTTYADITERMAAADQLEVMKPEAGTKPRVYYRNLWRYSKSFIGEIGRAHV